MSHKFGIRLARPEELQEFTLRNEVKKVQSHRQRISISDKFQSIDMHKKYNHFRPYTEVLKQMERRLNKSTILKDTPPRKVKQPLMRHIQTNKRSKQSLSQTNINLNNTLMNKSDLLINANVSSIEQPSQHTIKKFHLKISKTDNTELFNDLRSTLKLRQQRRHSRTYSQIHRDKAAFALASQLSRTQLS